MSEKKRSSGLREVKTSSSGVKSSTGEKNSVQERAQTNWTQSNATQRGDASQSRAEAYDSWSESLSESESDVTSYYSQSESESDTDRRRASKGRPQKEASGGQPLRKKPKVSPPPKQEAEPTKKSPIKMTFMKKQNLMKKENKVLNGRRSSQNEEPEALSAEEDLKEEALSPSGEKSLMATVSRREELLQQLKIVEDAIARKRKTN